MKLYIYDHCPFCIKVMLAIGYLGIECDVEILMNDDESTPVGLIGKKMLPILVCDDGKAIAESDDIVLYLSRDAAKSIAGAVYAEGINEWKASAGPHLASLVFPRYMQADMIPEFATDSARNYFRAKKEAMLGKTFAEASAEQAFHLAEVTSYLKELSAWLPLPSNRSWQLSFDDIAIYPWLRNLTLVKPLLLPKRISDYLDEVTQLSGMVDYRRIAL